MRLVSRVALCSTLLAGGLFATAPSAFAVSPNAEGRIGCAPDSYVVEATFGGSPLSSGGFELYEDGPSGLYFSDSWLGSGYKEKTFHSRGGRWVVSNSHGSMSNPGASCR